MNAFLWWLLGVASFLPLMVATHYALERIREGLAERSAEAAFRYLNRVVDGSKELGPPQMSNFQASAYHPRTGQLQQAMFLDDYFGKHHYGVKFADGQVFPAEEVKVPPREPVEQPKE